MGSREKQDVVGIISLGLFLALVGVIIVTTPNWYSASRDFFEDFELVKVNGNVFLPAPAHPTDHKVVYTAVERFCLVWGAFQIGILVLRVSLRQSVNKWAGTFSGIVFWLGAAYVTSLLLAESVTWFGFWAGIVILVGLTIIARSLAKLLYEFTRPKPIYPRV